MLGDTAGASDFLEISVPSGDVLTSVGEKSGTGVRKGTPDFSLQAPYTMTDLDMFNRDQDPGALLGPYSDSLGTFEFH